MSEGNKERIPDAAWRFPILLGVPAELAKKGVRRIDYPTDPEEIARHWRTSTAGRESEMPDTEQVWVGQFKAEDTEGPTYVVYVAQGDDNHPDPKLPLLKFTRQEWEAFVGGAKDGEFDINDPNQGPADDALQLRTDLGRLATSEE